MFRPRHLGTTLLLAAAVALMGTTALASQLTQLQQGWLDATLTHLYGSVSQAPDGAADRFKALILEHDIMIQAPNPLGTDDNLVPNVRPNTCDALVGAVRAKPTACSADDTALRDCLELWAEHENPSKMCAAQKHLFGQCMDTLATLAADYSKYCGS